MGHAKKILDIHHKTIPHNTPTLSQMPSAKDLQSFNTTKANSTLPQHSNSSQSLIVPLINSTPYSDHNYTAIGNGRKSVREQLQDIHKRSAVSGHQKTIPQNNVIHVTPMGTAFAKPVKAVAVCEIAPLPDKVIKSHQVFYNNDKGETSTNLNEVYKPVIDNEDLVLTKSKLKPLCNIDGKFFETKITSMTKPGQFDIPQLLEEAKNRKFIIFNYGY